MPETEGKIEYTPEELQEIERILNYISQETSGQLPANNIPVSTATGIKEHLYSSLEEDEEIQHEEEYPEEIEILDKDIEEYQPEAEEQEETQEQEAEGIEDITDLIQEIEEEKISEETLEESAEDTFKEIPLEEISVKEEEPEEDIFKATEEDIFKSAEAEQQEAQTTEEESDFDLDLLAQDFEQAQDEEETIKQEEIEEAPDTKPFEIEEEKEPLLEDDLLKEIESPAVDLSGPSEADTFDLNMREISPTEEIEPEHTESVAESSKEAIFHPDEDEFPDIDFTGLDEKKKKPEPKVKSDLDDMYETDISSGLDKIHELLEEEKADDFSLKMEEEPVSKPSVKHEFAEDTHKEKEEIELTDSELRKLNKVFQFLHPNLTKAIKDIILSDLLPGSETRDLVDMLLAGAPEKNIKSYVEEKLNRKIDISLPGKGRRVIAARPEYTKEGKERKVLLYKMTGIFASAAVALSLLGFLAYKNIYIPVMAKKYIDEGVSLIKKPGVPVIQKQKDYKKAEELFNNVMDNYIKDYLYGYHSYAKAYFKNKEYDYALEKLNKAYDIDASNVDTLNNLGFFYSKVPPSNFEKIKPHLNDYYYKKIKAIGPIDKQIDVAIDFYKKAINIDPKNITALYGIGNAYTAQGEFAKAREFYENILKVDKESVVGYSGLLNLYIERDALPEILTIHTELGNKEKLTEVPSALLAKLASYYLTKKKTDEKNIRIDYGIQSPAIKDYNDNPYPAVRSVLSALSEKDINYPPLFLLYARLSREENNLELMKRNLLTAIEKEPNYFAAHILLAEYYYSTNEPVEAYKSCKNALQAYLSPPEFTNDDFYHETEIIGTAYAIMGNVFYYADKAKYRFGDEFEDETAQEQNEELANYSIAQDKYEKAIAENYKSGEVFYNLGRIYYLKNQYDKAADSWLNLYEEYTAEPELLFALGNAFYHQNNMEAAKGEFMKVISIFESKADNIRQVLPERTEHTKVFQSLGAAYNNLGAVYQIQNNETKSNLSYWKAIDYSKKLDRENEFARVNMARAFKPNRENVLPILDENIAPSVENYREFK